MTSLVTSSPRSEREANLEPVLVPGVPEWLRAGFEEAAYASLFTSGSGPRYFDVGKLRLLEAAMRLTNLHYSEDGLAPRWVACVPVGRVPWALLRVRR